MRTGRAVRVERVAAAAAAAGAAAAAAAAAAAVARTQYTAVQENCGGQYVLAGSFIR